MQPVTQGEERTHLAYLGTSEEPFSTVGRRLSGIRRSQGTAEHGTDRSFVRVDFQTSSGVGEGLPSLPPCYFREDCQCAWPFVDKVAPALAVTARETKQLMEAHVRYGHRNFRSLAKALNMRLPAKIPFCQACVEAKSTRHPKSAVPRPLREPAPRPGYRIHFDPFGPFPERLADGTFYGLLFADAFSSVLWFDTLPTLKDWFARLKAVVAQVEADKGSERVVAQLATDSAPMFKENYEYRKWAASKGIVLLFSAPYTQKFNAPNSDVG